MNKKCKINDSFIKGIRTMQHNNLKYFLIVCSILMFSNILVGTLGAHLWHSQLVLHNGIANFATARDYLFIHTLSMLFLALLDNKFIAGRFSWIAILQLLSIILFSGSLMLYALTGEKWLSNITPLGGSGLMLSWLLLIWRASKIN